MAKKENKIPLVFIWKRLLYWGLPFIPIFIGLFYIANSPCADIMSFPLLLLTIGLGWLMLLIFFVIKQIYK